MASEHFANQAVWTSNHHPTSYPELASDLEVDVAIVGGGITGISTAYQLIKEGK